MSFSFKQLEIKDVIMIELSAYTDDRGIFTEMYKESIFQKAGINDRFVQDNISLSKKGVLRGLHFQHPPYTQAKLIKCISGEIFDVAVDLRKGSPSFSRWVGINLSSENNRMLYIPEGFAHGFLVLSSEAIVMYKTSNEYAPSFEGGLRWNDGKININWPLNSPKISEKDQKLPFLSDAKIQFIYKGENTHV